MNDTTVLTGGSTISGQVVNLHSSRPPDYTFHPGHPFPGAWVGLNDLSVVGGRGIFTAPCDDNSNFTIPNVPAGNYQLVIFDENLDIIFGLLAVTVTQGQDLELGQVPVFNWFGRLENTVFYDTNENGFPDPGEPGIPEQVINIRWRDGSLYQTMPTDLEGFAPFEEVFPFFAWLVAEVDYARFKPTGATVVVDNGGAVLPDQGWDFPSFGVLNPQPQFDMDGVTPLINPNTGNNLSRTETGPVVLEAFQLFLGQTNVIHWGKSTYDLVDADNPPKGNFPGPEDIDHNGNGVFDASNGGITGIVYYSVTRAENDPRYGVGEPWEPGIPRVQVNLYTDYNNDKIIDDVNNDGVVTLADVDNYPFNWTEPAEGEPAVKGTEDIDRDNDGVFDMGDAINYVRTDSWDDNQPTGAQGPPFIHQGVPTDCYDGLRVYNQVRPGVFDGGYGFFTASPDSVEGLPEGYYIVEACPPPGYEIVKEEDKNVDFGDEYQLSPMKLPPICVGDPHLVPAELALFPGVPCEFAGQTRPLCDRKQVLLNRGENAAADFFMFTEVPIAAHIYGFILDDMANEFDPNAPTFGEKYAPPWLPVSIRDWTGKEIHRVYSDQWGVYNALVPSTYTANRPMPSGMAPNMLTVVLNSPGPILDENPSSPTYGQYITDPFFNRQYSQFSYTFQYMPGVTTYLDTPVIPIAAFAGANKFPLDVDFPDGTPVIYSVTSTEGGPYIANGNLPDQTLTIVSAGDVHVPNPKYDMDSAEPKTIARDYGFGTIPGKVTIGDVELTDLTWTAGSISGKVPVGTPSGQLMVTRSNGKTTVMGIYVTIGPISGSVYHVNPSAVVGATPIQNAIDVASPGDLILVAPGKYDELVIMWKPVQLQGWGAYSTAINAVKTPAEKTVNWRNKIKSLVLTGSIEFLPTQDFNVDAAEFGLLFNSEGAGITVLGLNATDANGGFGRQTKPRIDGFTIAGSDSGEGIFVNGYGRYLEISNNKITLNQGNFGGGIRIGHPDLIDANTNTYQNAFNDHIKIRYNHIVGNGGLGGVGGGISLYTGSDNYEITDNHICGNYTTGSGGGIGHQGYSDDGLIARNKIYYNESFDQGTNPSGGGIFIGGATPIGLNALTAGSGCVVITGNLIQGNEAGAGDGGAIRLEMINGQDVAAAPDDPSQWCDVIIANNIIANNVTGVAGAISLQDSAKVDIVYNTIVHNDSTATGSQAFSGNPNLSNPQCAGIIARAHSPLLRNAFGTAPAVAQLKEFSNPELVNNIIWENRSFYFFIDNTQTPSFGLLPDPATPVFNDLAVYGTVNPSKLNPLNCILTNITGYDASNISADPKFAVDYFNGSRQGTIIMPETTTAIQVAAAFDEGGNFIDVSFGPLTLYNPDTGVAYGDYHILADSPAIGLAQDIFLSAELAKDYDNQLRPNQLPDSGADEYFIGGVTNGSPRARDDAFTMRRFAQTFSFLIINAPGIIANDSDPEGNTLTASVVSSPSHGTLSLSSNGLFTYTPVRFYTGTDVFTYKVSDGTSDSNIAAVSIRITDGGNTAPVAVADTYETTKNTKLILPAPGVMSNDTDVNGDTFYASLVNSTANGTLAFKANGSFEYTPNNNYIGTDTFRYRVYDGFLSAVVTVTINVLDQPAPANNPPAPTAAGVTTMMDQVGYDRVLPNDPDIYDTHTYQITTPPVHGTATVTVTGIVTYNPNMNYIGTDSLIVTVTDQNSASAPVTVSVVVSEGVHLMPATPFRLQNPPDTDGIDTNGDSIADNDHLFKHIGAGDGFVNMADGSVAYCFGFSDLTDVPLEHAMMEGMLAAEFPAPTLKIKQGDVLYLNLSNVGMVMRPDLFDPHTIHWHGFPEAASIFDGVPDSSISINMGSTLTYYYNVVQEGTYLYHCHVEATEHMQMGMIGNLYVTPIQDGNAFEYPPGSGKVYTKFAYNDNDGSTGYDIDYPMQMASFDPNFHTASITVQPLPFALMKDKYAMLNGRGYPDTIVEGPLDPPVENGGKISQKVDSLIRATKGQKILLRTSNVSVTRFFTLSSPSIPMEVVGKDAKLLRSATGENLYYKTNSITLGGGEAADIILDTSNIDQGTYVLYTTNYHYLSNDKQDFGGMMTEIVITE